MYRLYAADGALLYIGSSYDPEGRCKGHQRTAWWPLVERRTDEWYDSRDIAYGEERRAIKEENPAYNFACTDQHTGPAQVQVVRQAGAAEEEAQRFMAAVEVLKQMKDPAAQARAITQVLQAQPGAVKALKGIRREYVLRQRAAKITFRAIAADLGVSVGTVQDIVRGYSGSYQDRPRTGAGKVSASETPPSK